MASAAADIVARINALEAAGQAMQTAINQLNSNIQLMDTEVARGMASHTATHAELQSDTIQTYSHLWRAIMLWAVLQREYTTYTNAMDAWESYWKTA